jgi:hypothetical protein
LEQKGYLLLAATGKPEKTRPPRKKKFQGSKSGKDTERKKEGKGKSRHSEGRARTA